MQSYSAMPYLQTSYLPTQMQGFSTFPHSQAFIMPLGLLLISLPNPGSLPKKLTKIPAFSALQLGS